MVLQIAEKIPPLALNTPTEWSTVQAGYEGAIDHLDSLGIVDRERVGIQGWSRTGPHMGYTLTHSEYSFAAGAFTDSGDMGWWWYLAVGTPRELDADYGAEPFGEGLKNWLELSPSFNLPRVRTPMMMWSNGSPWVLWDWYAGLRRLSKPVEYWYLPNGAHEVVQARQLIRTNQLLVDWFDFWLNGTVRKMPNSYNLETAESLATQYERWEELKSQQAEVLQQPRPPLLQWIATPVPSQ